MLGRLFPAARLRAVDISEAMMNAPAPSFHLSWMGAWSSR
jgi:hypothetical protein